MSRADSDRGTTPTSVGSLARTRCIGTATGLPSMVLVEFDGLGIHRTRTS
ncbi:hypothetical protein NSERUTF1_4856 [Nocardia seriolae]|nr:hypothetical protein NSERUTF1_4856 [Nocardia seriolae]